MADGWLYTVSTTIHIHIHIFASKWARH